MNQNFSLRHVLISPFIYGSLVTISNQNPNNFILIVIDNCIYGSTGNQPTYSQSTDLLNS
ncbi:MAG: hypothetical protein LBT10_05020 [Methanobrevibacter sp.]|nr:hypothetical protein [Methanobrevibacter sp.]